jgi:hypothetical protein
MVRAAAVGGMRWFRPDIRICQDYHLWARLACAGPCVFLDEPLAIYTWDAPDSLARDPSPLLLDELKARTLMQGLLRHRPDCRPHWQRGVARCLAHLRDHAYRAGQYAAAARYGLRALSPQPWKRPAWEWRCVVDSALRATARTGR